MSHGRQKLTARQREVYDYILESLRTRYVAPTLREICGRFGISSTNGARDHLRALQRKGWITMGNGEARSIQVLGACPLCGGGAS